MKIAFDTKLFRPGCVLIQAGAGGNVPRGRFADLFPVDTWLLFPTPDMGVYEVTEEQLDKLSLLAQKAVKK